MLRLLLPLKAAGMLPPHFEHQSELAECFGRAWANKGNGGDDSDGDQPAAAAAAAASNTPSASFWQGVLAYTGLSASAASSSSGCLPIAVSLPFHGLYMSFLDFSLPFLGPLLPLLGILTAFPLPSGRRPRLQRRRRPLKVL